MLEADGRAVISAGQEVARQGALLDQARIQLDKFTRRAPLGGTVLALDADPGQKVDAASVLMTLTDLGRLVVETNVDEAYATQVKPGQGARLLLSGETEVRAGTIRFV